mmetsp:Transcript_85866/g.228919  ORF Transcript_85866/g.228919 Transcript_85866/m.228919 type:complete len:318 (+) Transcript_85866:308-1261(+)
MPTIANDSDSSEFEDEFDEELFKGDDDRQWIMTLNELEREATFAERQHKRELAKEAWMLNHQRRKNQAIGGAASKNKAIPETQTISDKTLDDDLIAGARRWSGRDKRNHDKKKQIQQAALDDLEAKREAQSKKHRATGGDEELESDDEVEKLEPRRGEHSSREAGDTRDDEGSRGGEVWPEEQEDEAPAWLGPDDLNKVRVDRDRLATFAREPFFAQFVQGLFVRVNIGCGSDGSARYLVCEVAGVRDKSSDYQLDVRGQKLSIKKALFVTHAGQGRKVELLQVSNRPFTTTEVQRYSQDVAVSCCCNILCNVLHMM